MFWPRDDDDGVYFHNHTEDMALSARMMRGGQLHRGASGEGSKFLKDWVTGGHPDDYPPSSTNPISSSVPRSMVSEVISDVFNIPGDGFADLVITVNERNPIFAHKVVVASWSNRLLELIKAKSDGPDDDDTEDDDRNGDVQLLLLLKESAAAAAVFDDFIQFMYTESVDLCLQNAWPLLELAAKYRVEELLVTIVTFLLKHVVNCPFGPSLVQLMGTSVKSGVTRAIVSSVMTRLHENLFIQESDVIASFEVDLLCDVLRCSDVIAVSEFDIYQKLKPKLHALKQQGSDRDILRLLSLLRFTQMKSSQLDKINSSEYSDMIRENFPGRLQLALRVRALFAEQSLEDLPINTERSRLYLERPISYFEEAFSLDDRVTKHFSFAAPTALEVGDVTIEWKDGNQLPEFHEHHEHSEWNVLKLLLESGEHGVTNRQDLLLSVPTGSVARPTVGIRLLGNESGKSLIHNLITDCHITSPDLPDPKRIIVTRILNDLDDAKTHRVNILPDTFDLADTCKIKVRFMCYACVRDEVNLGKSGFGWTPSAQDKFRAMHC